MKKNRPLYAALLAALLIISAASASLTASAVSVSEILETTYSIDQILFRDDEINGFTFVYYDKADNTVKNMVYLPIGESRGIHPLICTPVQQPKASARDTNT